METGWGQPVTIASVGTVTALRVDAAHAYVSSYGAGGDARVLQVPFSGGASITLASGLMQAQGLAVTDQAVYFATIYDAPTDAGVSSGGAIVKVPIGGGAVTTLASAQAFPSDLAADSTTLYWSNSGQCTGPTSCTGTVVGMPLTGGTVTTLASGLSAPQSIALDASNVYWGASGGKVMKVPKSGGTPTELAFYQTSVRGLVVEGSSVYWAMSGGDVMKTPVGGGPSTSLVVSVDSISAVAADPAGVYWTTYPQPTGTVRRILARRQLPVNALVRERQPAGHRRGLRERVFHDFLRSAGAHRSTVTTGGRALEGVRQPVEHQPDLSQDCPRTPRNRPGTPPGRDGRLQGAGAPIVVLLMISAFFGVFRRLGTPCSSRGRGWHARCEWQGA